MADSIVAQKAFKFSLRIVKVYKYLKEEKQEYVLSKQLLRCGTSIGANVEESIAAQSNSDFIHKLSIAQKEARETSYWLRLLYESDYLEQAGFESIHTECLAILKMLTRIILTAKQKITDN
jgi:four helix bundle protein